MQNLKSNPRARPRAQVPIWVFIFNVIFWEGGCGLGQGVLWKECKLILAPKVQKPNILSGHYNHLKSIALGDPYVTFSKNLKISCLFLSPHTTHSISLKLTLWYKQKYQLSWKPKEKKKKKKISSSVSFLNFKTQIAFRQSSFRVCLVGVNKGANRKLRGNRKVRG